MTIEGQGLPFETDRPLAVFVGNARATLLSASARRIRFLVPSSAEAGRQPIVAPTGAEPLGHVQVGRAIATGLHQVDNPAVDAQGNVYVTFSGTRGQQVPVSIFRVRPDGTREDVASGILNATSLAFDRDGDLCVTSRFDGCVYQVKEGGRVERIASELGVACGLAFTPEGSFYVGDRSGTLFRVNAAGRVTPFATLPASMAAFHVAIGPDEAVYVSVPTLSSSDRVYRVDHRGQVEVFAHGFGRPQGLAFDRAGRLHVVEALAGGSGLYRVWPGGRRELVAAGAGLVGVAFPPGGGALLASSDTLYQLEADLS